MSEVGDPVTIAGVRVTSPSRVLFDELVLTKEALARYYESAPGKGDRLGLESFVKTSGGKGLHVMVPLAAKHDWDEVGGRMKPMSFHAGNVAKRMRGLHSDPWTAFRRTSQTLTAAMNRKLGIAP